MEICERRRSPRFDVSLEATVKTQQDFSCSILVFNISSSGLQFCVAQQYIPNLIPNNPHSGGSVPIPIEISLKLQNDAQAKQPFSKINCRIVYIKRSSMHECTVGCRFEQFIDNANRQLEAYIHLKASQSLID
jgi:hypothetical protein